uniref:Uncharacterized protein n=1 Tax=Ixodes ricinus TaxID=34613 RepID=A0A0K8R4F2_IXORI
MSTLTSLRLSEYQNSIQKSCVIQGECKLLLTETERVWQGRNCMKVRVVFAVHGLRHMAFLLCRTLLFVTCSRKCRQIQRQVTQPKFLPAYSVCQNILPPRLADLPKTLCTRI